MPGKSLLQKGKWDWRRHLSPKEATTLQIKTLDLKATSELKTAQEPEHCPGSSIYSSPHVSIREQSGTPLGT